MDNPQKERKQNRKENLAKLENKWKASMAGKPIVVLSPEKPKPEPKPEPPPPPPPTNKQRMKELMGRNKM